MKAIMFETCGCLREAPLPILKQLSEEYEIVIYRLINRNFHGEADITHLYIIIDTEINARKVAKCFLKSGIKFKKLSPRYPIGKMGKIGFFIPEEIAKDHLVYRALTKIIDEIPRRIHECSLYALYTS